MKMSLVVLAAAASLAVPAQAQPVVYEGTLALGVPQTGSVPGFGWVDDVGAEVDFWRFNGAAGQRITLRADRTDLAFDPAFSLYSGITTADRSEFSALSNWGGLTFLDFADDEIAVPGESTGDPLLAGFELPTTGGYTVAIGGYFSAADGPYGYTITLVPEPSAWLALIAGLGGLAYARRRTAKA